MKSVDDRESADAPEAEPETRQPHDLNLGIPQWTMLPLMAVTVALVAWAFGVDRLLLVLVPFAVMLSAIAVIDLRELRVPNRILLPSAIVGLPLLVIASTSSWPEVSLVRALIGAAVMGGIYLAMGLIYPAGMGFGDIKLAPFIGAQLALFGWVPFVRGLLAAFLLIGPVAIILLLAKRAGMGTGLPFAPFMGAGAILALVLHARGIG